MSVIRDFINKVDRGTTVTKDDIYEVRASLMQLENSSSNTSTSLVRSLRLSRKRRMQALADMAEYCHKIKIALKKKGIRL